MQYFILGYIGLNCYLSGYWMGDNWKFLDSSKDKRATIVQAVLLILFGSLLILFGFCYSGCRYIIDVFQLRSFWALWFGTKYHNLELSKLEAIKTLNLRRNSNSINDRMHRFVCNEIFKINNYPSESKL